jgi:signal peptidase I
MECAAREPARPSQATLRAALCEELHRLVRMVLLFVVLFWGLKSFVVEGYEVEGTSMEPALQHSDRILVFKLPEQLSRFAPFLGVRPVRENEVVVFNSTVEAGKRYVKRVIVAGPPLRKRGTVSASALGGPPHPERVVVRVSDSVPNATKRAAMAANGPAGRCAREEAYDDVTLGPGDLYVLGDHRSVSRDSRSFGPVNAEQVVGRAVLVFWPMNRIGWL